LDEAFVDLSGTERLHGSAEQVARVIKQTVHHELQLVVSVGVGPSKFIAKIASDLGKPDGMIIVKANELEGFLFPLPVSRVFGVGQVTEKALSDLGISTIGELATFPKEVLRSRFGELGDQLWELSHGIDDRPVVPERPPKSIGHEDTFATDREDLEALRRIVQEQADRVAHRLRSQGYSAQTVVLKAKTPDFKLHTRRRRLPRPTCDGTTLGQTACELLTKLMPKLLSVRLTGVSVTDLSENQAPSQLTFDEPEHQQKERLAHALDDIMDKFGTTSVRRASSLEDGSRGDPDV
jgi:DNA polymerase-4